MCFASLPMLLTLAQIRIDPVIQRVANPESTDNRLRLMLILALGAVALFAVAVATYSRYRVTAVANDSSTLLLELCRAHHLSRKDRGILRELSRVQQLSDPTLLLVDAKLWNFDAKTESSLTSPETQTHMHKLQCQLFAQSTIKA